MMQEAELIITNRIICTKCGGAGHISSDCKMKYGDGEQPVTWQAREKMDTEYMSLMAELGQGPAPDPNIKGRSIISKSGSGSGPIMAIEMKSDVNQERQASK